MAWRGAQRFRAATAKTSCWALVLAASGCFSDPGGVGAQSGSPGSTGMVGPGSTGSSTTDQDPSASTSGPATVTPTDPGSTSLTAGVTTDVDTLGESSTSSPGSTTGVAECVTRQELFNVELAEDDWEFTDEPGTSVVEGALVLSVTENILDDVNKVEVAGGWTGLEGASVTVELGQTPTESSVIQMVRFTEADPVEKTGPDLLSFRVHMMQSVAALQIWHSVANANQVEEFTAEFNPNLHRWLRVTKAEELLVFETSEDGREFSPFYDMVDIFDLTGATVGMAVNNYQSISGPESVSFESFELVTCAQQ